MIHHRMYRVINAREAYCLGDNVTDAESAGNIHNRAEQQLRFHHRQRNKP